VVSSTAHGSRLLSASSDSDNCLLDHCSIVTKCQARGLVLLLRGYTLLFAIRGHWTGYYKRDTARVRVFLIGKAT
jgi:hypothetical protein